MQLPPYNSIFPLTLEQLAHIQEATDDFNTIQLAWLSGYFWAKAHDTTHSPSIPLLNKNIKTPSITLISASQTGNARRVAEQLRDDLLQAEIQVNLVNAGNYKFKQINQEKILILVVSTHGEGEPPEEAVAFYKFLMSKKAPKFKITSFAIFSLGDTSYDFFCQFGKNLDNRLSELGAVRLLNRVDADVDYNKEANVWRQQLTKILKEQVLCSSLNKLDLINKDVVNKTKNNLYTKDLPLNAKVMIKQKITGRYSSKDVRHIEISLGDSGLCYKPGDALGVWYENNEFLIKEMIDLVGLKGDEPIKVNSQTLPLNIALQKYFELTVNTSQFIEKYAYLSKSEFLLNMINNKKKLQNYAQNIPIVDLMHQIPIQLNAEKFTELLRPLTPRLYSISSSQSENKAEVHITVNVVRYQINGHIRGGGASTWLADLIEEDSNIRIFIEHNDHFRLPIDPNVSVIMIGAGTGIAPFRAFMQQRDNDRANGSNWLFFGNPNFTEDFLYQVEWQQYVKDGLLTNIDLAWSRDQDKKIYVQDKIYEKGDELSSWIKDGAHIYVCGSARMAKNVEQALIDILVKNLRMTRETADEFLSELRIENRYQRDIY